MVFQGTKKTNKGQQLRLQTLSFDLYMKNQGRGGGGGGGYRRDHGSLSGGGGGLQTRPWISAKGVVGPQQIPWLSTGGRATEETMDLYRGRRGYRRDHGLLSGVGGLQKRPWVSIGGRGVTGETMGLYRGGGGLQARPWVSTRGRGGGAKQILWVSSRGWGAIRGGHHLHLFWWVLSLYSSFDQFPYCTSLFLATSASSHVFFNA